MPNYRIQYRRDTAENWESINPILLDGEVGYEITEQEGVLLQKVGDGVMSADGTITGTHWNDLPYVSGPIGPAPDHEWQETSLRFRNPNGSWGNYTNLQGPQGIQGIQGEQGEPGTAIPATKTSLGGIIVGDQFDITTNGCLTPNTMLMNTEEIITASGNYTIPVTGWYSVTLIGGGSGGVVSGKDANAGLGSIGKEYLMYYEKDTVIPVTIGAGGSKGITTGTTFLDEWYPQTYGGKTTFGDLEQLSGAYLWAYRVHGDKQYYDNTTAHTEIRCYGGGQGGGDWGWANDINNGAYYGAGGGAFLRVVSGSIVYQYAGNGYQGAVILRYYDPAKNITNEDNEDE